LLKECRTIANNTRSGGVTISQLLKRPGFTYADLPSEVRSIAPEDIWELLETDIKYEGYTPPAKRNTTRSYRRRIFKKSLTGLTLRALRG